MNNENTRTFSVPEWNMETLRKKISRIQKKCEKLGCEFHYAETGEEFRKVETPDGHRFTARFVLVEALGTAAIPGWEFAASIDHTEAGNIVRGFQEIEIPESYYHCKPFCEHCRTSRDRKNTYLVRNTESGAFFQLGKSCLLEYTKGLSAEQAALCAEFAELLDSYSRDYSGFAPEHEYFKTEEYLRYAAECVAKFGYCKRNGGQSGTEPTAMKAHDFMLVDAGKISGRLADSLRSEMDAIGFNVKSPETAEQVKDALAWAEAQEDVPGYIHNLKTACGLEYLNYKNAGIVASLIPAYLRAVESEKKRKLAEEKRGISGWAGEVGERITVEVENFSCIAGYETQFGYSRIWKIVDAAGNVYIWKTTKFIEQVSKITGTVKEHNEFRGEKQTELTRCKIA